MAEMMTGKRGLIMGVANERSIAWGIAQTLHAEGAELAFTYQGDAFAKRVIPLAGTLCEDPLLVDCDVMNPAQMDSAFATIADRWGSLDFIVHAIAYSDKTELTGRFTNTSLDNFRNSMSISCFSFIDVARRALPLMPNGGSLITLTFDGSQRVMPNYNVMGVAKASLEASVRYLAADLGPQGIRVNAISAGPIKTLAASGISGFGSMLKHHRARTPLQKDTDQEEVGDAGLFLLSHLGRGVTGQVLYVDGGYSIMAD